jgi:hypothetical protein
MIRFVRTASIAPGRLGDSVVFAKQIVDYIGKNFGVKLEVMLPVGGNPNRIAWRTEYANLAALETLSRSSADQSAEPVKSGAELTPSAHTPSGEPSERCRRGRQCNGGGIW